MDEELAPDPSWGDPEEQDITGSTSQELQPDPSWGSPQTAASHNDTPTSARDSAEITPDHTWGIPEEMSSSTLGAMARRGGMEVVPGVAAAAAAVPVAGAATAGAVPFMGPFAPVAGLAAAIPTAIYVGGKAHQMQDILLDALGLRKGTGALSRNQEAEDIEQHPYASLIAQLVGGAAPSFGTGLATAPGKIAGVIPKLRSTIPASQRAIGAGIQGGLETGQELYEGKDLDPKKIAAAGAAGALFAEPRGFLPGQPKAMQQLPKPEAGIDGEVLPPEPQAPSPRDSAFASDIEFATSQRDKFTSGDPLWNFWNEHIIEIQNDYNNGHGKGRAGFADDSQWGPTIDGEYSEVTEGDKSRANDVTTTAKGVAAENTRAPEVRGAGNPVGAPMSGRVALRPNEPGRDYRKLPSPAQAGEAQGTTSGDIAPDLSAILHSDEAIEQGINGAPPAEGNYPWQQGQQPPADAVGRSQMLRPMEQEGLQAVQQKQAAGQQGEAFQDLPVTATVTEDQARLQSLREAFASMPQFLEAVDSLPPEQQAQALEKAVDISQRAQKSERDVAARPKVGGAVAASKGEALRKQGVLTAYDKAAAEFGTPGANEVPGDRMDRLGKLVRRADELAGGKAYKPRVKPPSYQLIQAARKALRQPTKGNLDAYEKAEIALREGDSQLAETNQAEKRIAADIEMRPSLEAEGYADKPQTPRVEHAQLDNSNGDESPLFKSQHDQLTGWLNNLSEENYKSLANSHGDLDLTVTTTQDPAATMHALAQELTEQQRKNPPRLKTTTKGGTSSTPIKSGADLAAFEGRRIDPKSAEGKAIAASAMARLKSKVNVTPEAIQAAEERATAGDDTSAMDHWARMLQDEGGAVPLDVLARKVSDWMRTKVRDFFHPRADPDAIDYANQIGAGGRRLNTSLSRIKAEVLANARVATYPNGKVPMPAEFGRMYRAHEGKTMQMLEPRQRTYWDQFVQPLLDRAGTAYDELRDLSIKNKLTGWDTMPERKDNGPGFASWMPRRAKGEQSYDRADEFEPTVNRSLSNWATSGQERDWFTLQNTQTGERKVYRVNADGNMVFHKNRRAGAAQSPPASFDPRQIGADLNVRGGGTWKVDHSMIDELMAHGLGDKGKPLNFSDNPVVTASDAAVGLRAALAKVRFLDAMINDPDFSVLRTTSTREADKRWGEGNHAETSLPQLKGQHFPQPVAWALDDLVKAGFQYSENSGWNKLARFSQAALKPFYFVGPEVHVLNELDKFIVGRGVHGLATPFIKQQGNFLKAVKSVWGQDGIQREILDAGGNPMYMHAMVSRLMPQIGKLVGEDLSLRPWKYDPLMKVFGTNTREALSHAYQQSNKLMWWQSDVLYTTLYNEKRADGMSAADAVKATEEVIDSYIVPPTFGKSIGLEWTPLGRMLQQVLVDPITANFGRFHYGLYHMLATVTKNIAGPSSTPAQRAKGVSQAAMLITMMQMVYPALSAGYAAITGNAGSEFEPRGVTKLANLGKEFVTEKKNVGALTQQMWTPSVFIDTVRQIAGGKDFAGRDIIEPPYGMRTLGELAEFATGQMVSPLKGVSTAYEQGGGGYALQRFLESNVGLKTPSQRSQNYEQKRPYYQNKAANSREKRPRGAIEQGINYLFPRR